MEPTATTDPFGPLISGLRAAALRVTPLAAGQPDTFFGIVHADPPAEMRAHVKASRSVCHFSMLVDLISPDELQNGASLLAELLRLNYRHVFGRISLAPIRAAAPANVLVCETMCHWTDAAERPDAFAKKVKARLEALMGLHSDAARAIYEFRHPASQKTAVSEGNLASQ